MNITVCIKQVPDSTEVKVKENTGTLIRDEISSQINPYDLYALETALQIKESVSGKISVITLGEEHSHQIIKEAYMMGADEGFLVSDKRFNGSDVYVTAYILSQAIKRFTESTVILCGKKSTDSGTSHLASELAEILNIPCLTNIRRIINIKEDSLTVEADMEDSLIQAEIKTPCILSVDESIAEPRLLSFRKKLQTNDREIKRISLEELEDKNEDNYGLKGSPTNISKLYPAENFSEKTKALNEKKLSPEGSPLQLKRIFPEGVDSGKEIWSGASIGLAENIYTKLKELKHV